MAIIIAIATSETPTHRGPPISGGTMRAVAPSTPRAMVAIANWSCVRLTLSIPNSRSPAARKPIPASHTPSRSAAKVQPATAGGNPKGANEVAEKPISCAGSIHAWRMASTATV